MKAGARIDCIKKIANELANYEWADIDLVLGQFKQPTSSTWSGTGKREYVVVHLSSAPDKILTELEEYVTGQDSKSESQGSTENIWKPNKFKLFVSHLSSDKVVVGELKAKLESYGVDCFVAHEDIDPTQEWQDQIESALRSCDASAVFMTKDFHESKWTDQEIGFCIARRILIIPLKVEINPYGFIAKYQALNCAKLSTSEIAKELFNILATNQLTSAKLSDAIVANFVSSTTWESARARSLLLEKVQTWTPELLRSIENSLSVNNKIETAFGVPERVKRIISTHSQSDGSIVVF